MVVPLPLPAARRRLPGVLCALALASTLLAARPEDGGSAPLLEPYGCGANPSGSLIVQEGMPAIGSSFTVGVDNPLDTQAVGSIPVLLLSLRPHPAFPCGSLLPGFGQGGPGASGELLIDPRSVAFRATGPAWRGAGEPVKFTIPVPAEPALVGTDFYLQGVLVDPTATSGVRLGLTEALHGRVGTGP